ncbi:hypothetical protein MWU58_11360 [Flavobacteriaceae bacterium S0825]|uniref:hypothetical protein n=1 Tax=Gaetbulibacter sp. S0825 TaxID=2720084 RepID=UPI00142FD570|nr:hypothetical protein [Gaetbulibacter sp. S0825]MCK0109893.1 hypothetical protein [Flavobacteriaceae bacterium S0825]NIX65522.1 hypothetical protein [Gaetbulibacter sp. S0825]
MENNPSSFDTFELNISTNIKRFLNEIAKWSFFLSIIGFIGIGLMVVVGLLFGTIMSTMGDSPAYQLGYTAGMGVFYVVIALIYFFPVYYLYKFSRKMKRALHANNNDDFESAFSNLKSHYKFIGIFAIIIFSLYLIMFLLAIVGASLF